MDHSASGASAPEHRKSVSSVTYSPGKSVVLPPSQAGSHSIHRPTRIIKPPAPPVATAAVRQMFTHKGWDFAHCSSILSPSPLMEAFEHNTGVKPPEITFLDNFLRIRHNGTGIVLNFAPKQALLECLDSHLNSLPPYLQFKPIEVKDASLWRPQSSSMTASSAPSSTSKPTHFRSLFAPYVPSTDVNIHTSKPMRLPESQPLPTTTTAPTTSLPSSTTSTTTLDTSAAADDDLMAAITTKLSFGFDWSYSSPYRGHLSLKPKPVEHTATSSPLLASSAPSITSSPLHTEDAEAVTLVAHNTEKAKVCEEAETTGLPSLPAPSVSTVDSLTHEEEEDVTSISHSSSISLSSLRWTPAPAAKGIDYDMLRRPDPILFYSSVCLYEDELHDNGVSTLSVKTRVMDHCWFALLRMFVRVDGVVVRIRDARFYHQFGTRVIYRETKIQEVMFDDMPALNLPVMINEYRDADRVAAMLPVKYMSVEQLELSE